MITQEAAEIGELATADLQISAETLRAQPAVAWEAGYPQLAANLTRAEELAALPNTKVVWMCETLRPGRASYAMLARMEKK